MKKSRDLAFVPELKWSLVEKADPEREEALVFSLGKNQKNTPLRSVVFDQENILDLSKETKYPLRAGQSAILVSSILSPEEGNIIASAGADFFFEFFVEGFSCVSTLAHGNGGTPVSANDRIFRIPVKKGVNHVAFYVRAGMGGWKAAIRFLKPEKNVLRRFSLRQEMLSDFEQKCELRYGPWITHASAEEASIRFTTSGFFACAIDLRKKTEQKWKRFYELWNGYIRTDTDRHAVHLSNLDSGTEYEFRIVLFPKDESRNGSLQVHPQESIFSPETYTFRTLPADGNELTFYVMSDTHMPNGSRLAMLKEYDRAWDFSMADFFAHLGDISTSLDNFDDELLGGFAEYFNQKNRLLPLCMVHGNHEYSGTESGLWNPTLSSRDGKSYYAFRAGSAFVIALDYWATADDGTNLQNISWEQEAFLRTVLHSEACQSASFRIILNHAPAGDMREEACYRAIKRTLLEMNAIARIDLFLAGHIHSYSSNMVGGTRVITLKGGERASALNLTKVCISGEKLCLQSGSSDGKIFDSLEIGKKA